MRFEFSAGGVVFKLLEKNIFILVSQHSQHHGWVFPKGLIGDHVEGEDKRATAVREVKEETGADGVIKKTLTPVTYWYSLEGEKIKKTVYYFVMEYAGGDITKHDHEMEDVEWLPVDEVMGRLTYKSDKVVFAKALPIIENLAQKRV
ncbi:MAG: NUDIX hydrolase [Candidatus Levybacteria bacterium CG10_big_fil_rev_8_21_14_0_10_36_7]|nr:MAG: NUDIX hydrolase [Candidatus Levybacteria bacterium CG10_big_fil_rev_8_21_14_0_10_36_7]